MSSALWMKEFGDFTARRAAKGDQPTRNRRTLPRLTDLGRSGSGGKVVEHKWWKYIEIEREERVFCSFLLIPSALCPCARTREGVRKSGKARKESPR